MDGCLLHCGHYYWDGKQTRWWWMDACDIVVTITGRANPTVIFMKCINFWLTNQQKETENIPCLHILKVWGSLKAVGTTWYDITLYYIILHYIILYYMILYYIILHYIILYTDLPVPYIYRIIPSKQGSFGFLLYYIILYCIILYYIISYYNYIILYYIIWLYCILLFYIVLYIILYYIILYTDLPLPP